MANAPAPGWKSCYLSLMGNEGLRITNDDVRGRNLDMPKHYAHAAITLSISSRHSKLNPNLILDLHKPGDGRSKFAASFLTSLIFGQFVFVKAYHFKILLSKIKI